MTKNRQNIVTDLNNLKRLKHNGTVKTILNYKQH